MPCFFCRILSCRESLPSGYKEAKRQSAHVSYQSRKLSDHYQADDCQLLVEIEEIGNRRNIYGWKAKTPFLITETAFCAEGGTRTRTGLLPHAPETCVSTSFTTSA